jgi:hypothetical protein
MCIRCDVLSPAQARVRRGQTGHSRLTDCRGAAAAGRSRGFGSHRVSSRLEVAKRHRFADTARYVRWPLRRVLLTGAIGGLLVLAGLEVNGGSRSRRVLVAAEVAKGTSGSKRYLSPQAQLNAALNAALGRLGGHLHSAAGISPSTGPNPLPVVPPPGVQGFACPVASGSPCSASPCRLFTGSPLVSSHAPVGDAVAVYKTGALGTARSLARQAGSRSCSSPTPARALPVSSTR